MDHEGAARADSLVIRDGIEKWLLQVDQQTGDSGYTHGGKWAKKRVHHAPLERSVQVEDRKSGLLDFLVEGVTTQRWVVLLFLHAVRLCFLVAAAHITGRVFAFLTGFRAFDDDMFPRHGVLKLKVWDERDNNTEDKAKSIRRSYFR